MPRIAARIPSGMNIRVIGRLVVTAAWVMRHRLAQVQAVLGIPIDGATTSQVIDGFGFSKAFQQLHELYGLSDLLEALHPPVLHLLFNPYLGTSFTILRIIIDSSPDSAVDHVLPIEPHRPGALPATPACVWDSADQSHIWFSHQVQRSGVAQFSAGAWSVLRPRKTNGGESSGETRYSVPGATYAGED